MKNIIVTLTIITTLFFSFKTYANNFYTLYGFKIGQKISTVKQHLGKPNKTIDFQDGWKAYVYLLKKHNVIFETNPSRPDLVISIQIEGIKNPKNTGIDDLNLGSNARNIIKKLGAPTERRAATDLKTKKEIPSTFINFYGNNLSFEEKNNKITSIKINFDSVKKYSVTPDFELFMRNIKSKNYYYISEALSTSMTLNGKRAINGSIINQIMGKSKLNTFLFGENGLASLTQKDITDINLRIIARDRKKNIPSTTGSVFKFKNTKIKELYFVRSFEGWVLYDAWKSK